MKELLAKNHVLQHDSDAVTPWMRGKELGSRHQSKVSRIMNFLKYSYEVKKGQEARSLDPHPYFTIGALFDQGFKSNFVIYQFYYSEQSMLPFLFMVLTIEMM